MSSAPKQTTQAGTSPPRNLAAVRWRCGLDARGSMLDAVLRCSYSFGDSLRCSLKARYIS